MLTPAKLSPDVLPIDATDHHRIVLARDLYRQRRARTQHFPQSLFAEPMWDMLLDLYIGERERRKTSVKSVCIAAAVPPSTALRNLKWLSEQGMIDRLSHPRDARSTYVRISAHGLLAMTAYLDALSLR